MTPDYKKGYLDAIKYIESHLDSCELIYEEKDGFRKTYYYEGYNTEDVDSIIYAAKERIKDDKE